MEKNNNYTLSAQAAAHLLAADLGDSPQQWLARLQNWRKPGRLSPVTWDITSPRPKYDAEELGQYAKARKQESATLALSNTSPTDNLPRAGATGMLADGHPAIAIDWRDVNSSGYLVLTITAAQDFADSLAAAIEASEAALERQFDQAMEMDTQALKIRMDAAGPDGELPTLEEAQKTREQCPLTSSRKEEQE